MAKYKLNSVALQNVKNHIWLQNDICNTARIKAIKENKSDAEIKMHIDMQVIYGVLMEELNKLNEDIREDES